MNQVFVSSGLERKSRCNDTVKLVFEQRNTHFYFILLKLEKLLWYKQSISCLTSDLGEIQRTFNFQIFSKFSENLIQIEEASRDNKLVKGSLYLHF